MRVMVLGAGASRACGLPLTNELLPSVLSTIDKPTIRRRLLDFLEYQYPYFRHKWKNFPNLEEFLSLIDVYLEFSDTVKRRHKFPREHIRELKRELLRAISMYLCEKSSQIDIKRTKLFDLVRRLREGDVVITFNWDYLLERSLDANHTFNLVSYTKRDDRITLLKPHGSVDWLDSRKVPLKENRTFDLIRGCWQH